MMSVKVISDEGQTPPLPRGKVLGIVDTKAELDAVSKALQAAGFNQISALKGEDGVNILERVDGFFFSDMEQRVLNRHIEELKAGRFILIVDAAYDQVEELVKIAEEHGARRLVHFGAMTVTWHTK